MTASRAETLAINGGSKIRSAPWPQRFLFMEEEKRAVMKLFDESMRTGKPFGYNGSEEEAYCQEFADYLGGGFSDAVNSGTSAVYVALRALNLEPFTEVIVPPVTDMGGMMPVPLINCIPVRADSAPDSYNMGPDQLEARLTPRTSAVIVAHIGGQPADMDPILEICRARNVPVIEDCAQAHGAEYKGRRVGTMGELAAFSTMSGKHHATGGQGGVVFTRREDLYWRCRQASDRGKPFGVENPERGNVVCSQNLNLNDLSACIGRVQLRRLPDMLARLREIGRIMTDGCAQTESVRVNNGLADTDPVYWFIMFKIDAGKLTVRAPDFVAAVQAEGVPASQGYVRDVPNMPWFKNRAVFGTSGFPWTSPLYKGDPDAEYPVPNAEATDATHMRIRLHESVTPNDARDIVAAIQKVECAYLR